MIVYVFATNTLQSCDYIYSPLCVRVTRKIRQGTLTIKARKCILSQFLTRVLKEINMFSLLILIGIMSTVRVSFSYWLKKYRRRGWNIYNRIKDTYSVFNFDFKEWQTTKFPCFFLPHTRQFFTHLETSPLPVKGCIFWPMFGIMAIEQWWFFSVPLYKCL